MLPGYYRGMMWRDAALKAGVFTAAVTLTATLASCASETSADAGAGYKPPTMAPEQTVAEACGVSREEVDQLVAEVEASVGAGVEQAGQDLLNGEMPSLDFMNVPVESTLDRVQRHITNSEVSGALERVSASISGFGEITQPGSLLEVPAYIGNLHGQLSALNEAGTELKELCGLGSTQN